jgi:hypothetical protein
MTTKRPTMLMQTQHSHRFWREQCAATWPIRDRFGVQNALEYLIGEKFLNFMQAAATEPETATELPGFAAEIRQVFTAAEIAEYLGQLQRRRIIARQAPKRHLEFGRRRFTRAELERLLL